MNTGELISFISNRSNRYGDKLVQFMERYGLISLSTATKEQLEEYIANELKR